MEWDGMMQKSQNQGNDKIRIKELISGGFRAQGEGQSGTGTNP